MPTAMPANTPVPVVVPTPIFISTKPISNDEMMDCPFCAEPLKKSAKKCKHCGETVDVALRMAEEARRSAEKPSQHGPVFMNAGGGGGGFHDRPDRSFVGWHVGHLILTLATCGLWLPVWIIHFVIWNSSK